MTSCNKLASFLVLFASWLVFVPNTMAADLKLVADDWRPFSSDKKGQRIAADLVEHALYISGTSTRTRIINWQKALQGIKKGDYDAIIGAWKNPQREQFLLFSRPYLENRILLVGRTDNRIEFSDLAQLENKKVGLVEGYAYGDEIAANKTMHKVFATSVADNLEKLVRKEIDYMLADSIVAHGMENYLPLNIKSKLVVYKHVITKQGLHFAVRKTYPNAQSLLDKFNKAIGSMIIDGTYNRVLGVDWLVADTDADGVNEYIVGNRVSNKSQNPADSTSSYSLFSSETELGKKSGIKYRVLNQEYDSWDEAQQAINKEKEIRLSPNDEASGTFDFLINRF